MNDGTDDKSPLVLIVDDDADTRDIVGGTIETLGVRIEEVDNGSAALEFLESTLPDLVILDVMMPKMNGFEVCQRFKQIPGSEAVPVLMLTARDEIKDIVDGLDGGAEDYLTKPFNYQELQARVRALLRVRQLNVHLQQTNDELREMQEKLVEQERQALVGELAGAAAHELGQPLSALLLNCHLLEKGQEFTEEGKGIVEAMKRDAKRMKTIVEQIREADASKLQQYSDGVNILDLVDKET